MTGLRHKLHSEKGETLAEIMASVLICTLSVALLFSGIMVANRINRQAEASDKAFFEVMNLAEQEDAGAPYKSGTVLVTESGGIGSRSFPVNYYGNESICSYKLIPQNAAGGDSNP